MKHSSGPRKTVNLSESVHHQLNMYAIAATAAGVGVLVLAQPGEAKIVYTPIAVALPPNSNFELNSFLNMAPLLTLKNTRFVTGYPSCSCDLFAIGDVAHYSATYSSRTYTFANALASGARIGPRLRFGRSGAILANVFVSAKNEGSRGQWRNVTKRYLGIRFQVNGQFHYGWARLNVSIYFRKADPTDCKITASLSGYAYETIPNKPIVAGQTRREEIDSIEQPNPTLQTGPTPEPATLGALAMGAPGLSIWRRREYAHSSATVN